MTLEQAVATANVIEEIAVTNVNESESEGEIPRGLVGIGQTAGDTTTSATHQGPSLFLKRRSMTWMKKCGRHRKGSVLAKKQLHQLRRKLLLTLILLLRKCK